jgi:hypothetical protein
MCVASTLPANVSNSILTSQTIKDSKDLKKNNEECIIGIWYATYKIWYNKHKNRINQMKI